MGQLLSVVNRHIHRYRGKWNHSFCYSLLLSTGFHFVWISQDRVVVPLPRRLNCSREAVECFLVVRLLLSGSDFPRFCLRYISLHTMVTTLY